MDEHTDAPSAMDLAGHAGMLVVGLTTLTIQIFPFAFPLLILVIGPLAVLALAGLLLVLPILVPLLLGRKLLANLRGRRPSPGEPLAGRGYIEPGHSGMGSGIRA